MRARGRAGAVRVRSIGLIGRFGSGNIGNDTTLEALLAHLSATAPHVALDCLCTDPHAVRATYGIPATQMHTLSDSRALRGPLRRLRTAVRIVAAGIADAVRTTRWARRHDLLVVVGTGGFETTLIKRAWEGPWVLACLGIASRVLGVPLLLLGVGASPIRDRLTRALLLGAVRSASWVAPRDVYSCRSLTAMGVPVPPEAVMPDLAYLSPALHPSPYRAGKPVVGVGVIDWRGGEADEARIQARRELYTATMSRFVDTLTRAGYDVHLFIGDLADAPVGEEIARGVPAAHYRPTSSSRDVVELLAQVDLVVASRYHSVLLALAMGVPTIAVGYGGKHIDLMRAHRVGEYALWVHEVSTEQLYERFAALQAERLAAAHRIRAATVAIRAALVRELSALDASLAGPLGAPVASPGEPARPSALEGQREPA